MSIWGIYICYDVIIAYQKWFGGVVLDLDIRFEYVKVEGGGEQSSVTRPLLTRTQQQSITYPVSAQPVRAKRRWLRLCKHVYKTLYNQITQKLNEIALKY